MQGYDEICIYQKNDAGEMLKKLHTENCKATSTPMNQKEKLSKEGGTNKIDDGKFRSLIRCLMYLIVARSDISICCKSFT